MTDRRITVTKPPATGWTKTFAADCLHFHQGGVAEIRRDGKTIAIVGPEGTVTYDESAVRDECHAC